MDALSYASRVCIVSPREHWLQSTLRHEAAETCMTWYVRELDFMKHEDLGVHAFAYEKLKTFLDEIVPARMDAGPRSEQLKNYLTAAYWSAVGRSGPNRFSPPHEFFQCAKNV